MRNGFYCLAATSYAEHRKCGTKDGRRCRVFADRECLSRRLLPILVRLRPTMRASGAVDPAIADVADCCSRSLRPHQTAAAAFSLGTDESGRRSRPPFDASHAVHGPAVRSVASRRLGAPCAPRAVAQAAERKSVRKPRRKSVDLRPFRSKLLCRNAGNARLHDIYGQRSCLYHLFKDTIHVLPTTFWRRIKLFSGLPTRRSRSTRFVSQRK